MTPENIGPLGVRSLGRGEPGGPAILLCHGFGAPGDDLVGLARGVDAGPGVRWFFPEGPSTVDLGGGPTGRAWWHIDIEAMMRERASGELLVLANQTPPGLSAARLALEQTIDELVRSHGVTRDRLILGGFSQGAMLATEVVLFSDKPFAGLVVLSGTVISLGRWNAAIKRSGPSVHALISHGLADPMLPFAGAEALRDLVRGGGGAVTWVPHRGQHEIPGHVLKEVGAFARKRLGT